jgi:hypothetical protein
MSEQPATQLKRPSHPWYPRWWVWVIAAAVLLLVVLVVLAGVGAAEHLARCDQHLTESDKHIASYPLASANAETCPDEDHSW